MIPVSKEVATKIIIDGTQKGFSVGYINNDKSAEYNVYIREYDNFTFKIAENENQNEYFALENTDIFEPTHNFNELRETIKDGPKVLSEVVNLLEEAKKMDIVKVEVLERMKLLKLHPNIIKEFEDENKLNRSEYGYGILFWLEEHEQQLVDEFQNKHKDYLVYHVIKTETRDFGTVYDLLYVTPYEDDWTLEREDLKNNLVMSYSVTEFAECGLIKIKCINGGLAREY